MMKSKLLAVSLIALLMIGGLVLAACGDDCTVGCYSASNGSVACSKSSCSVVKAKNSGGGFASCDCN